MQLLSLFAATPEAHVPRACAPQEKPPRGEAQALQLESLLSVPQLKKAHEQQKRPTTAQKKFLMKNVF